VTNHGNRNKKKSQGSNPAPAEVRKMRQTARLTLAQAGELLYTSGAVFTQWETNPGYSGHRRMHPAFWELFCIKVAALKAGSVLVTADGEKSDA
jgi:hypothetical protein